jgi:hypothetical protein
MKDIHIIPTDKPSRLYKTGNFLLLDSKAMPNNTLETINQNIYITNSEEIKGDWFINESNQIEKGIEYYDYKVLSPECKKRQSILWLQNHHSTRRT